MYQGTPTIDTDIATDTPWQKSMRARRLVRWCCVDSTALADTAFDIYFGTEKIGHIQNTREVITHLPVSGDFVEQDWFWHSSKIACPPGVPVRVICTDAAAAEVTVGLDFQELSM